MDQMTQKAVTLHIIDDGPLAKEFCLKKSQRTTLPVLILILTVSVVSIDIFETRSIHTYPETSRYLLITSPDSTVNRPHHTATHIQAFLTRHHHPLLHYFCIIISLLYLFILATSIRSESCIMMTKLGIELRQQSWLSPAAAVSRQFIPEGDIDTWIIKECMTSSHVYNQLVIKMTGGRGDIAVFPSLGGLAVLKELKRAVKEMTEERRRQ